MTRRRFILLDRDGTIIVERHYLSDPKQVELISGAALGLALLRQMGFGLVVITNQSGIGRGLFDRARLELIHRRLCAMLAAEGVYLDGIYFCPHTPEDECSCRKPKPGLVEFAAAQLGFDPRATYVIGDQPCDIELGQGIGATTFLVHTGYGAQVAAQTTVNPDYEVEDLCAAVQTIKRLLARDERTAIDAAW